MISYHTEPKEPKQKETWDRVKPHAPTDLPAWVRGPFWHNLLRLPAWSMGQHMVMLDTQEHEGRKWLHVIVTGKKRPPNSNEWHKVVRYFLPGRVIVNILVADSDEYLNEHPTSIHMWVRLGPGRPVPHFAGIQTTVAIDL